MMVSMNGIWKTYATGRQEVHALLRPGGEEHLLRPS